MTTDTLLPHNATPLERALEQSTARLGDIALPIRELWDPATCPLDLLPWLAWALSTDRWETHWSEDQKRDAVANAIERQRKKGTPASIDAVLASFDALLTLTEWFEMQPRGEAHTFDVTLPLLLEDGTTGGFRTSAEFAEAIIRDVTRTKPARSHFRLLQSLEAAGLVDIIGVGRTAGFVRLDTAADTTIERHGNTICRTKTASRCRTKTAIYHSRSPFCPPFLIYFRIFRSRWTLRAPRGILAIPRPGRHRGARGARRNANIAVTGTYSGFQSTDRHDARRK
jgi:phage tail P2-like protein